MLSPRGQSGLGQNFGLGLEVVASASRFWPRPGLDLVVLLCNRAFFVQKSCKIGNFVNVSGNNLKSYDTLLTIIWYFFIIIFGLGLGLEVVASASRFWPRPGLSLVLLCNRASFVQKSCKIGNFVNFSGNNIKSYVVNHYLVLFS